MAAKKSPLRSVAPNEKAPTKPAARQKSVSEAALSGDRLSLLVAMRTRIAKAVGDDATPARDLAALTRRLLEIAKDIEVLQKAAEEAGENATEDAPYDASAI